MMTFFFGQRTHVVRELKSANEVRERKISFDLLDVIPNDKRPLRHLSMELTAFLSRDGGSSTLTSLALHFP